MLTRPSIKNSYVSLSFALISFVSCDSSEPVVVPSNTPEQAATPSPERMVPVPVVRPKPADDWLARVGSTTLTPHDLADVVTIPPPNNAHAKMYERQVLEALIDRTLIDQELERRQIDASTPEVDIAVRDSIRDLGGQDAFEAFLRDQGLDEPRWRRETEHRVASAKLCPKTPVEPPVLHKLYQTTTGREPMRHEIQLSSIVLRYKPGDTRDTQDAVRARLQASLALVTTGDDFSRLVKEVGQGPLSSKGGALGWVDHDALAPETQRVITAARAGSVTAIADIPFGFTAFFLHEKRSQPSEHYQSVEPLIRGHADELRCSAYLSELVAKLRESTTIEYAGRVQPTQP